MEQGRIEVKFKGRIKDKDITPKDIDISEIREIISDIESFLFPSRSEKAERPHIAYSIEDGSAKHNFYLPLTAVILFNGLTTEINKRKSIDFLEYKRAEIIEKFQRKAKEKGLEISFSNSLTSSETLVINNKTNYFQAEATWIETELYLYGEIYEEGGINPNLHIITKEYGRLTVSTTKEKLTEGENKLYKIFGLRVSGKQNLKDRTLTDLELIEYLEYNPVFNKSELDILIAKATPNWAQIKDPDLWLRELRGGIHE